MALVDLTLDIHHKHLNFDERLDAEWGKLSVIADSQDLTYDPAEWFYLGLFHAIYNLFRLYGSVPNLSAVLFSDRQVQQYS